MKNRIKLMFWSLGVLAASYCILTFYYNDGLSGGDYFSSGVILMSDGDVLQMSQRLYSDGPELYNYVQVGSYSYEMHFLREYILKGYVMYVNKAHIPLSKNELVRFADRDISFNSSYTSRPGSRLTLSEIITPYQAKCLYVYELSSVYCYGAKRSSTP